VPVKAGPQTGRAVVNGRPRGQRSFFLACLGLLLVALMAMERLAFLARAAPTDFDDAYTYLRYTQHWLSGHGVAWNEGEGSVFGVTSLLHLVLVTAIRWAFPQITMARVLQTASGAAAVALLAALVAVAALCCRHPRLAKNWVLWSAAFVALLGFREAFGFHAGTGMDTMLSALCNAVLVFFVLRLADKPTAARAGCAVAAAVLSVLARPDNVICATLSPALAIALLTNGPRAKLIAGYVGACAGAFGLLAFAAWRILGSPVPLSFFAKQPWFYGGFAGEFGWNPFRFLGVFLLSAWPFVVAVLLFADRSGWRRTVVLLAPALLTIASLFRFNQIMGHLGRFYYPFLPFFVVAGALQFDGWLSRAAYGIRPKAMLARAALAIAIVFAVRAGLGVGAERYAARGSDQRLSSVGGYQVAAATPLPEVDSWESARQIAAIAGAAPAGARFAMSEHGLPGALAPHVAIVDVLGLHDPTFARRGFSAAELFRRRPDVIWMPHADHTDMLRDIVSSDGLWGHYDFYPEAFFHGIAIRRDGPYADALAPLLVSAWNATYPGLSMADYRARPRGRGP
jgi:hypothetical protein